MTVRERFMPQVGWGPGRKKAALSISFDNLGEAADIEFGVWGDRPVGNHYTARFVPQLVDLLGDIRATYFVEASNAAIYPQMLRFWRDAGHEIGMHAWRHENWETCPPQRRRELLDRSMAAMREAGVEPSGFRPPGGALTPACWAEFEAAGLRYCSDLSDRGVARVGNLVSVPFRWSCVDSYRTEDLMAPVRVRNGDPETPVGVSEWRNELTNAVARSVAEQGQLTIVFHPMFLAQSEEKLGVVTHLIAAARQADMWIAPVGDIAGFCAHEMGLLPAEPA